MNILKGFRIMELLEKFIEFKVIKLLIILFIVLVNSLYPNKDRNEFSTAIYEPILPKSKDEYIVKEYNISKFNLSHPRYYFQEKYKKRKRYRINYSYYPYIKISSSLSFDENLILIYNQTGMLNITKLEYYYYKKNKSKYKRNINILELNHIHISMALDKNYTDFCMVSIASILNTSNSDTYIHFHILAISFLVGDIKKIISLRKINNKVEFIFYNAKQAEYDFLKGKDDRRGIGNYAKILIPEIVNNTNKILILDSGDILCQKDLSEIYFYDIKDNYFGWILERCAGNINIFDDKFMTNNFHPNTGVVLVNIRLFRKDELYKKAVFVDKSYHFFKSPTQDILITVANYKFKYIPLNYNLHLYHESRKNKKNRVITPNIKEILRIQRFSKYKYNIDEIFDAMNDPVVYHLYIRKIHNITKCDKIIKMWLTYAKLAGVYKNLKSKYPKPFKCENPKFNFIL
jgi:lipopolysaccharide biosynthesis glycosyltransferase